MSVGCSAVQSPGRRKDQQVEDAEETLEDEEPEDDEEPEEAGAEQPSTTAAPAVDEEVESIQEILVKQEARSDEAEEEDDSVLNLSREERLEPLAVKVVPPQASEFICSNCFLVKHRSQLKDKAKMLCRDCA